MRKGNRGAGKRQSDAEKRAKLREHLSDIVAVNLFERGRAQKWMEELRASEGAERTPQQVAYQAIQGALIAQQIALSASAGVVEVMAFNGLITDASVADAVKAFEEHLSGLQEKAQVEKKSEIITPGTMQ